MSLMNIAGTQAVDDPEYRYKMPRLQAKIEGRGNGIKTLVVNCADIALALHRSTAEVCKFFGTELCAQSKYDEKNDRAIVNGAFESGKMQSALSKYIEGFVLCPQCRLPETKYKFKGAMIFHKCYACGAVEPVDLTHKLTTFILKEHAAAKREKDKKKDKKDKKTKKAKGDDEPEKEETAPKEKKEKKDKEGKEKKEKKEKKDKEGKEKKEKKEKKKKSKSVDEDDEEEIEWHTDLSPEAVAARAAEAEAIENAARAAMAADAAKDEDEDDVVATLDNLEVDDENAIESAVSNIQRFLGENHADAEIFDEICRQQTYAALPINDRLVIFFRAAFTSQILSSNQVAKYAPVLEKLVVGEHAQKQLIALTEHFCAVAHPELLSAFPVVLKVLYDEDVLDEEVLVAWPESRKESAHWEVNQEASAKLTALMKPFVEWLENAEEESDDDDEDDE